MIDADDEELAAVIRAGGYDRRYVADIIVDGDRVKKDVPLASCELRSRGVARIRNSGSAVLAYSDELGSSVVPEDLTSWLTPYVTYLNISMVVSLGEMYSRRVFRGTFKLTGVSDPVEQNVMHVGRTITLHSVVSLTFMDAFVVTDRERYLSPTGPESLDSAWAEMGRVTGLPLLRNVPDKPILRDLVYKDSRLDAAYDLGAILGGAPYVNPAGQVAIQPIEWGDETEPLSIGEDGTITRIAPESLTDEGIYNQVVVRSFDSSQQVVLATAEVTEGPLRYGGPFGRIPYFASSEFITTTAEAQAYADQQLPKVSTLPALPFSVQCLPDPRREVGDVVPLVRGDETLIGRIDEVTLPSSGPMTLRVLVKRV